MALSGAWSLVAALRDDLPVATRPGRAAGAAAALLLGVLGEPGAAFAISPSGSQFQVNSYTTGDQVSVDVWRYPTGFVAVWGSLASGGSDTSLESVQGRRFDASGSPIDAQFQINTYTTNNQRRPKVASDSAGNFIVVWDSNGGSGSDTAGLSVQGQRFDSSGSPIGAQFQVNTYTTSDQIAPSIASDPTGNFVVVWHSTGSFGGDVLSTSVQGQRYDASGAPIGGQFQVNTYTTSSQRFPSVASDSTGAFVVAWESYGSTGSDTSTWSVQGRRYDASGAAIGGEFQVNTHTTLEQRLASVASASAGNFVVVWQSDKSPGSDTDVTSVHGQRYDASGAPIGGQFQINTYTTGVQSYPRVTSDSGGDFVVVWTSGGSAGGDTDASALGQAYDASGSAIGGEFQVNTLTTSYQGRPSVASDPSGNFVVVWRSFVSVGDDTSAASIQGQRYVPEPSLEQSIGAMVAVVIALARRRLR
jgi:hypothetical protein